MRLPLPPHWHPWQPPWSCQRRLQNTQAITVDIQEAWHGVQRTGQMCAHMCQPECTVTASLEHCVCMAIACNSSIYWHLLLPELSLMVKLTLHVVLYITSGVLDSLLSLLQKVPFIHTSTYSLPSTTQTAYTGKSAAGDPVAGPRSHSARWQC